MKSSLELLRIETHRKKVPLTDEEKLVAQIEKLKAKLEALK